MKGADVLSPDVVSAARPRAPSSSLRLDAKGRDRYWWSESLRVVLYLMFISGLAFVSPGCDSDSTKPDDKPHNAEVDAYLASLPGWGEFCPLEAESPPTQVGGSVTEPDETVDVEFLGDNEGENYTLQGVVYACKTKTYSMAQNPDKIVIFNPDAHVLYPGALIQGKDHAEGYGSMQPLPIAERAPIRVSIPDLPTGDNYREVVPNQATVAAAIGEMVGNAVAEELSTPSSVDFRVETFHSEQEWALSAGMSGRYLGFSASASSSIEETAATTTVSAHFFQKMFTVVVEAPQTPGTFFSEEFTQERLQEQIDLGKIGPDNIPVYVANVVYGRMMMFSMTSTASATEMEETITAGYDNLAGGIEGRLTERQKNILASSQVTIASIGGPAEATIAVIRSGNWRDYFTENAELSTAVPISYTLVNLGDGSIATVTETSTYNIRECTAGAGTFTFGGDGVENYIRPTVAPPSPYEEYSIFYNLMAGFQDCDMNGYPVKHRIRLRPHVTETEIVLIPGQPNEGESLAYAYTLDFEYMQAKASIGATLFTAPDGWRITRVGGMSPSQWEAQAYSDATMMAYRGMNPHFSPCGIFEAQVIGDLVGDDFIGCPDIPDREAPMGIYALKIEETEVELECIDCN